MNYYKITCGTPYEYYEACPWEKNEREEKK